MQKSLNKFLGPESEFTKKLDPDNTGGVVNDMRAAIERVVKNQIDTILEEFSLNNEEGALSRLTAKLENDSDTLGDEIKGIFDLNNESSHTFFHLLLAELILFLIFIMLNCQEFRRGVRQWLIVRSES